MPGPALFPPRRGRSARRRAPDPARGCRGRCPRPRSPGGRRSARARPRFASRAASSGSRSRAGCRGCGPRRPGRPRSGPRGSATASSCPASAAGGAQRRPAARTASTSSTLSPGVWSAAARASQQVVDERAEPVELRLGLGRLLGGSPALGPDRLQAELDPGQRRAQLVRGVGDEVPLRGQVRQSSPAMRLNDRPSSSISWGPSGSTRASRSPRPRRPARRAASPPAGDRAGEDPGEDEPGSDDRQPDQPSASQLERTLSSTSPIGAETRRRR